MFYSYKDLLVWQKAVELVVEIYTLTRKFPRDELYGLTSQMRRSAVSIASNIAEGKFRNTNKGFLNFLIIAYSSGAELETHIEIGKRVYKINTLDYSNVDELLEEVMKMLNRLIRVLGD